MCLSFCSLTVQRIIFWVINVICHLFGRISRISWLAFPASFWLAIRLSFYHKWLQRQEKRGCLPKLHYSKYTTWHWMSKQMFKVWKTKLSCGKWFGKNKWLNFQDAEVTVWRNVWAAPVKPALPYKQIIQFNVWTFHSLITAQNRCLSIRLNSVLLENKTLLSPLTKPVLIMSQ